MSRALAMLGRLVVLALVLAHVALLWQRIATQTLLEPVTLLRWAGSLGLVGWVALRHRRGQGFSPRAATVFWLVVVLLHVQVGATVEPIGAESLTAGTAGSLVWFFPISIPLFAASALLVACLAGAISVTRTLVGSVEQAPPFGLITRRGLPRWAPRPPPEPALAS